MELNSSDPLYEDEIVPLFSQSNDKIGESMVQKILDRQKENRVQSKHDLRNLSIARGSPGVQWKRRYVERLWDTFLSTMKPKDRGPYGDTVFRFLDTYARNLETRIPEKTAPSLSTVQSVWNTLEHILVFRHQDLHKTYNRTHRERIRVLLDGLVTQGILLKGVWLDRKWIGLNVLTKISTNFFREHLSNGCLSWDKVLIRALVVSLQSALVARAGDIARAYHYTGDEYLRYEDITLMLPKNGSSIQDLQGTFVLKYCKGDKDSVGTNKVIYCNSLVSPSVNVICPIKLLVIHALRHQLVNGKTWQELIKHTKKQPGRRVLWTRPEYPVLPQFFNAQHGKVRLDAPMATDAFVDSFRHVTSISGLARAVPHDIRRGAIRDIAFLDQEILGTQEHAAGLLAGHNHWSIRNGITRQYIGPLEIDSFSRRADNIREDPLDPAVVGPQVNDQRTTPREIDSFLDSINKDKSDVKNRSSAARAIRANRLRAAEPTTHFATPQSYRVPPAGVGSGAYYTHLGDTTPADNPPADPTRLESLRLTATMQQDPSEEIQVQMECREEEELDDAISSVLKCPPEDFVKFFSQINVCRYKSGTFPPNPDLWPIHTGGSRKDPTLFQYLCGKGECEHKTDCHYRFEHHLATCSGKRKAVVPRARADKDYFCEKCDGKRFKSFTGLRYHEEIHHESRMKPKACPYAPKNCDQPDKVFKHQMVLQMHLRKKHGKTVAECREFLPPPRRTYHKNLCPEVGCGYQTVHMAQFRSHLRGQHQKTHEETFQILPMAESEQRSNKVCHVEGCFFSHTKAAEVGKHMISAHGYTKTQAARATKLGGEK